MERQRVGTQNGVLQRDCAIASGDAHPDDAFDPSLEWVPLAVNDGSNLGLDHCP